LPVVTEIYLHSSSAKLVSFAMSALTLALALGFLGLTHSIQTALPTRAPTTLPVVGDVARHDSWRECIRVSEVPVLVRINDICSQVGARHLVPHWGSPAHRGYVSVQFCSAVTYRVEGFQPFDFPFDAPDHVPPLEEIEHRFFGVFESLYYQMWSRLQASSGVSIHIQKDNMDVLVQRSFRWVAPTHSPTRSPTLSPTLYPTRSPTPSPTRSPTRSPTPSPTRSPTRSPTWDPAWTYAPVEPETKTPVTRSPTETLTLYARDSDASGHLLKLSDAWFWVVVVCAVVLVAMLTWLVLDCMQSRSRRVRSPAQRQPLGIPMVYDPSDLEVAVPVDPVR